MLTRIFNQLIDISDSIIFIIAAALKLFTISTIICNPNDKVSAVILLLLTENYSATEIRSCVRFVDYVNVSKVM